MNLLVEILSMLSATHKQISSDRRFGARQGWMDGLQMLEGSSYHWYASLCNVVQDQAPSIAGNRAAVDRSRPTLSLQEVGGGRDAVIVPFSGPCIDPYPNWGKLKQKFQLSIMH
jgi:hypothetical protein